MVNKTIQKSIFVVTAASQPDTVILIGAVAEWKDLEARMIRCLRYFGNRS